MTKNLEFAERLEALLNEARAAGALGELKAQFAASLQSAEHEDPQVADPKPAYPQQFGMIGASEAMASVFALIEKVAPSKVSVLILGETGTGKELVARALHDFSPRSKKLFLAENCAAVPAELLEGELFGHVKGSFTGAIGDRQGHFVAANGGTVFLDEIGDMPLVMQSKLLRVLQEGEVRPVGSNKVIQVDVRIVAATNKDLPSMVAERNFREDLYYRLNVITISLPPLRDRLGDVRILSQFFLDRLNVDFGRQARLSEEAAETLESWSWPGNIRELENEIQRAVALSDGMIEKSDLSPRILGAGS